MRVLYVTNQPAPYKIDFFTRLSEKVDLTVAYERRRAADRDDRWYVEKRNTAFTEVFLGGIKIGADTSCSLGAIGLLKDRRFDVVIMNGFSSPTAILTISYMILHKIPYGIMCDGMIPHRETKLRSKLKRILISNAEYCFGSNEITSELLEKYGAKRGNIHIYSFTSVSETEVDTEPCDKSEYKRRIGCADENIILYVGSFIHRKGVDILLKACESLDADARLILIGGAKDALTELRELPNCKITILDFMKKSELEAYYRAADVFVLPTRYDIWGLVVNEALSKGLPVITTENCGAGLAMIHSGENGFIVPIEDSAKLAEALDTALKDCGGMRESALEAAREYTIEKMAAQIYAVLRQIARDEQP